MKHDRKWCHKTWPSFFGLKGPRALKGSPGLVSLVETTQQRDLWPHKGHGCSPATDCRHEQRPQECAKPHMLTHVLPGTGPTHTDVPVCRADMPRCPCRGWTHTATSMALTTHSKTWAQMPLLSLPLWCQTLKGKIFYYLKGPPVQCLFFFFPFSYFLNVFWKQAYFIYSKYISRVENK